MTPVAGDGVHDGGHFRVWGLGLDLVLGGGCITALEHEGGHFARR